MDSLENHKNSSFSLLCQALVDSFPVFVAYFPLSLVWGMLWEQAGLPPVWGVIFSACVYAGAVQFIALSLFLSEAPLWELLVSVIPVAARNSFYTIALLEKLPFRWIYRIYMSFGLVDATFAILIAKEPEKVRNPWYSVVLTIVIQIYWILGTAFGVYGGGYIQNGIASLDFALPALITVLAMEQYNKVKSRKLLISAISVAMLSRFFFGHSWLIPALLICIVLVILDSREEKFV